MAVSPHRRAPSDRFSGARLAPGPNAFTARVVVLALLFGPPLRGDLRWQGVETRLGLKKFAGPNEMPDPKCKPVKITAL